MLTGTGPAGRDGRPRAGRPFLLFALEAPLQEMQSGKPEDAHHDD